MIYIFYRCIEQVKNSQYIDLAHDLEIDKAIMFLKQKDFNQVTVVCLELKTKTVDIPYSLSVSYFLRQNI